MKIVNLISGPRNLSTALMYSFAQRADTKVLDEPFYAYYLSQRKEGVSHPSAAHILESMSHNQAEIVDVINNESTKNHVFVKGMAHHYVEAAPDFILKWDNVILIRHPKKLLASFSKVIENPTVDAIGIKKASEIFEYLKQHHKTPLVIDSDELLKNPETYLLKICKHLDIPFSEKMLHWNTGGIPEDGVWASHWYKNVHNSEGFVPQKTSSQPMPERLNSVLEEALTYYTILQHQILKND